MADSKVEEEESSAVGAGAGAKSSRAAVPLVYTAKSSSVLNGNRREYGPAHLFDGKDDTCWNSDQGASQTLTLKFKAPVRVDELRMMFQGGFVGKDCVVSATSAKKGDFSAVTTLYPEDVNETQTFSLEGTDASAACGKVVKLRLEFNGSTDFYGRVTMYHLEVLGEVLAQ